MSTATAVDVERDIPSWTSISNGYQLINNSSKGELIVGAGITITVTMGTGQCVPILK